MNKLNNELDNCVIVCAYKDTTLINYKFKLDTLGPKVF